MGHYDSKEANHACVAVECPPERAAEVQSQMKQYSDDDPRLAAPAGPFAIMSLALELCSAQHQRRRRGQYALAQGIVGEGRPRVDRSRLYD